MLHIAFVTYYTKYNKYSFNALIGALKTVDRLAGLPIYFYHNPEALFSGLNDIIPRYDKIILGLSFCTPQMWEFGNLIHNIRDQYYDAPLILIAGGPHPTGEPLATLKLGFDMAVVGEGEETLIAILERIEKDEDYTQIRGIAFLDDEGNYCFTGKRDAIDLDNYPPFAIEHKKFSPIEITRGCPYGCYFCQKPHLFGTKIRHRSLEHICDYVKILKKRGLHHIRFTTPNAFSYGSMDGKTVNLSALEELLSMVKKIISLNGKSSWVPSLLK